MLLRCQPANRVVPLIYRRSGTEQDVVPAAMFPVSRVRRGPAADVRPVRGRCRCPVAFGEVRTGAQSPPLCDRTGCSAARRARDKDRRAFPSGFSK
ncbi:hypothetical protein ABVT39_011382 [Epinephelus coioides]